VLVVGAFAFVVGIFLARACDEDEPPPGDPVVDSAVSAAPRERAKTDTIIRDADSTLARVKILEDSVHRSVARALRRRDSLAALKALLAADSAASAQDSIANYRAQVEACEAQAQELAGAVGTCQQAVDSAQAATGRLKARLVEVQFRADSIPLLTDRAFQHGRETAPCRRDWLIVEPSCTVVDVVVAVTSFTGGVLVAK
jgi:multidrug resistance efflux pump